MFGINPLSLASQVFSGGKGPEGAKELTTDVLKVRGRTIIFKNSIYQISNIAAIEILSFSRAIPWIAVVGVFIGLLLISFGGSWSFIALAVIAWSLFTLYRYWQRRREYGLLLLLNSGVEVSTILMSRDEKFLIEIALVINSIMNDPSDRAFNFYLDQRKISEEHYDMRNSIVNNGTVGGDIANNIVESV